MPRMGRRIGMAPRAEIPNISPTFFTEPEAQSACLLETNLKNLDEMCARFHFAITLLDHADVLMGSGVAAMDGPAAEWKLIAMHEGAMSMHHFKIAMRACTATANEMPTVKSLYDRSTAEEAKNAFTAKYPDAKFLRHAVSHCVELTLNRFNYGKSASTAPYDNVAINAGGGGQRIIAEHIVGRRFTSTQNGKNYSYDLSEETLKSLMKVRDHFYRAFAPAALALLKLPLPQHRKSAARESPDPSLTRARDLRAVP